MNYRVIFYVLGCVVNVQAAAMLLPMICAIIYNEPSKWVFAMCAMICLVVGMSLVVFKPKDKSIFAKEGFVIVALSWLVMSIIGAIPFVASGSIPDFIDAFFESASGFSTTGASILSDVDVLPKSILFWRSFTHWIGGMGVIVFLVALMPISGGDNLHLIRAESTGPAVGKLVPRVKTTAKILYIIYFGMTIVEIILLKLGGLDWFESLTLSFGTAGTGGFAVKNSGLMEYSPYVQWVITIFMTLFGVDFAFYYLILRGKLKSAFDMEEVRIYLLIILGAAAIIFFNTKGMEMYSSSADAIRHSAFQVSSIITTTGYSTVDFDKWPQLSKMILLLLMYCGACSGSTGGGMKVTRIVVMLKSIIKELKVLTHPKSMVKVKMNGRIVEHETLRTINVFFISYVLVFVIAMLIISLENFDFTTNFTAVTATLSNIGPGLAQVGPTCNFSIYSPLSTFVMTLAMIIGRLEIFPMLILFSPRTWKK